MSPSPELQRSRALLIAIKSEEAGLGLSGRVKETMEVLLDQAAEDQRRKEWVDLEADGLRWAVGQLGGPASAARMLGVLPSTIRRWGLRERIPAAMLSRMTELIEARAEPIRRPRCRHEKDEPVD